MFQDSNSEMKKEGLESSCLCKRVNPLNSISTWKSRERKFSKEETRGDAKEMERGKFS